MNYLLEICFFEEKNNDSIFYLTLSLYKKYSMENVITIVRKDKLIVLKSN